MALSRLLYDDGYDDRCDEYDDRYRYDDRGLAVVPSFGVVWTRQARQAWARPRQGWAQQARLTPPSLTSGVSPGQPRPIQSGPAGAEIQQILAYT